MKSLHAGLLTTLIAIAPLASAVDVLSTGRPAPPTDQLDPKGAVGSMYGTGQGDLMTLGNVWIVAECCGWSGTWTRRPGSNVFDATWRHTNGTVVNDQITLRQWNRYSNEVTLWRRGNNGTYSAVYDPAARAMRQGRASWYPAGASWSATIR